MRQEMMGFWDAVASAGQCKQSAPHSRQITTPKPHHSEWQWHQMGHMQVCTSLQTDNHATTPPLSLLQAGCPSCRPTNSVKALKSLKKLIISTVNQ